MTNVLNEFAKLLADAPAQPAAGSMSVVGLLSRSANEDEFVLTLADGETLTLKTKEVKSFAVLGGSVGQQIVRVDVAQSAIPSDRLEVKGQAAAIAKTPAADLRPPKQATLDHKILVDPIQKVLWGDPGKHSQLDVKPLIDVVQKPVLDQNKILGDPVIDPSTVLTQPAMQAQATLAPFALATPHHLAAEQLAMMQAINQPGVSSSIKALVDRTGVRDIWHPKPFTKGELTKDPPKDTTKDLINH